MNSQQKLKYFQDRFAILYHFDNKYEFIICKTSLPMTQELSVEFCIHFLSHEPAEYLK